MLYRSNITENVYFYVKSRHKNVVNTQESRQENV